MRGKHETPCYHVQPETRLADLQCATEGAQATLNIDIVLLPSTGSRVHHRSCTLPHVIHCTSNMSAQLSCLNEVICRMETIKTTSSEHSFIGKDWIAQLGAVLKHTWRTTSVADLNNTMQHQGLRNLLFIAVHLVIVNWKIAFDVWSTRSGLPLPLPASHFVLFNGRRDHSDLHLGDTKGGHLWTFRSTDCDGWNGCIRRGIHPKRVFYVQRQGCVFCSSRECDDGKEHKKKVDC
jgi:hypothetical protein